MDKFNSAKAIMIQGTMSNAGKSLIAAALCRIFRQDGYSVAPFKSQNMALNSYITAEGLEMGRAQVMQAEAAGTEPSVLMNPILLKPTSDVGSQVIVNGEVVGNMRAMEYFRRKREFVPQIMNAFGQLSARHDPYFGFPLRAAKQGRGNESVSGGDREPRLPEPQRDSSARRR